MAIIIEEEKNRSNLVRIVGWLVIFCIVVAAIYYVFFTAPQLVIITPSGNLSTIAPIVQNSIDPNTVIGSPAFKALVASPVPPVATSTGNSGGRPDPFLQP